MAKSGGCAVKANGPDYKIPTLATVAMCLDGGDPRYISRGRSTGLFPNISRILGGFYPIADAAILTFTNPNNKSIVASAPPKVYGISGSGYLDSARGKEIVITGASLVSSGTSQTALSNAGARVAGVMAKDRQLRLSVDCADRIGVIAFVVALLLPNGSEVAQPRIASSVTNSE